MGTEKRTKKRQKIILPPDLPPDASDEEIVVSDEDMEFISEHRDYAGFLSTLDTKSINKHVTRVANVKEDELEILYENRLKKNQKPKEDSGLMAEPMDPLPVKTLDGKLYYRTVETNVKDSENGSNECEGGITYKSSVKLTKAERRAKLKKNKNKTTIQAKKSKKTETKEIQKSEALARVKEDISAEEDLERKKCRLAELGTALFSDPEANVKSLKEMIQMTADKSMHVVKLALLSLLATFKDIIPGYRIRLPTEKEQTTVVSKPIENLRIYEARLLSAYKEYLQRLMAVEKMSKLKHVAVRCVCFLLDAAPHFNFRGNLLSYVIKNISSSDDIVRKLCCTTIKSLFINEGKHGGELTVEAVQMIANHVKSRIFDMHPDSIEVFFHLSFDEDLGKAEESSNDRKFQTKKKKRKIVERPLQKKDGGVDWKKAKQELIIKTKQEVNDDYKAAYLATDASERKQIQTVVLSALFEIYFRILKHTAQRISDRSEMGADLSSTPHMTHHPLLAHCLSGIGKYSHLIDLDYIGDLMKYLKMLASSSGNSSNTHSEGLDGISTPLTVSERLQCCIVAFNVMRNNLDALNVDLKDFFLHLYNILVEFVPGRDGGEVLAEALRLMLCEDRVHDMQRAAAFTKRLAMFSLCSDGPVSMAALATIQSLLQKNTKCRNLLENDTGGGSLSGLVVKYDPLANDPNLSGALSSVLWELSLLPLHYNPSVSSAASAFSNIGTDISKPTHLLPVSPIQAFSSFRKNISFSKGGVRKKGKGVKGGVKNPVLAGAGRGGVDGEAVKKKLKKHFGAVCDAVEKEKLRCELEKVESCIGLYKCYRNEGKGKCLFSS